MIKYAAADVEKDWTRDAYYNKQIEAAGQADEDEENWKAEVEAAKSEFTKLLNMANPLLSDVERALKIHQEVVPSSVDINKNNIKVKLQEVLEFIIDQELAPEPGKKQEAEKKSSKKKKKRKKKKHSKKKNKSPKKKPTKRKKPRRQRRTGKRK